MTISQNQRVLNALRKGPVTPLSFVPPTCDGGPPIGRLAARVDALGRQGHVIRNTEPGNALARYVLEWDAGAVEQTPVTEVGGGSARVSKTDLPASAEQLSFDEAA